MKHMYKDVQTDHRERDCQCFFPRRHCPHDTDGSYGVREKRITNTKNKQNKKEQNKPEKKEEKKERKEATMQRCVQVQSYDRDKEMKPASYRRIGMCSAATGCWRYSCRMCRSKDKERDSYSPGATHSAAIAWPCRLRSSHGRGPSWTGFPSTTSCGGC